MARVLLITKTPLLRRLRGDDHTRLVASGALEPAQLEGPALRHEAALAEVRAALAPDEVLQVRVEDLTPADGVGCDLVVTVGGDGTVFTANTLPTDIPVLAINSDPRSSVGHFTRARADQAADLLAAWRLGLAHTEALPRLRLTTAGRSWRILNDCLFTSTNPAAMTRSLLECPDGRATHRSSGVWIATAAGSTGAIRSAGTTPVEGQALLWQVREAFPDREAPLLSGRQTPPAWLRLTPSIPGIACYLDGPNITIPLDPGQVVVFDGEASPLRLLVPGNLQANKTQRF